MQLSPVFSARWGWLWVTILATVPTLSSAAPANDTCAGAITVPGAGPFPYLSPVVDISEATTAGDPPLPPSSVFDPEVRNSVWYRFTPTETALYGLSVGADTATTILDTSMVVYRSSTGCNNISTVYAFNEDSGLLLSAITTNLTAGQDYYIVVWVGAVEVGTSNLSLQLRVTKPAIPLNDSCAGAEVIPSSIPPSGYKTALTDTTRATDTTGLSPSCASSEEDRVPSRDVWYRFTPAATGTYIFSTKIGETATTVEDTIMAIYTSANGCTGPFTEVTAGCNDNDVNRASFAQPLVGGTSYYIVLWDNSPELIPGESDVQLRVLPASAPTVTTLPVVSIASTGAVLSGTINANGLRSSFWFEWGPTTGLGSTSRVRFVFGGSTATVSTNLAIQPPFPETLQPNTLYHYRFVASNDSGTSRGEDQTFRWSDASPRLEKPVRQANGDLRLQFSGNPFQLYLVQSTTNLGYPDPWENLGVSANTSGTNFQYIHRSGSTNRNILYRLELP